jgi:hypothetical protein
VQEFVNIRNIMHGYDLLEDADEAAAWLFEHGFLDGGARLSEADRRHLVAFREGLQRRSQRLTQQPVSAVLEEASRIPGGDRIKRLAHRFHQSLPAPGSYFT